MLIRERIQRMNQELKKREIKEKVALTNLTLKDGEQLIPYQSGQYFGQKNHYYIITGEITIQDEWLEEELSLGIFSSETEWDNATNPQLTLFLDDELIQALDVNHREAIIPQSIIKRKSLRFRLEVFSGREEKQFPLFIYLQQIDRATRNCYYDFYVALESWRSVQGETANELIYEEVLQHAAQFLDFRTSYSPDYYEGIEQASNYLKQHLYEREDFQSIATVLAVGHTHIDIAWLWTVQQAIEKGQRSFSTVLKLMEEYPDYTFIQSQPQMYQFIKEQYPTLYAAIEEKIKEHRWEPEGAMWVEADCNLTSGESLVRQIVHGKQFIKEEFGRESQVLWLPDVFGYSGALPQILKKTNTPYFMTTKLSWNQFNQIPFDTFYWQGIDGSEVLTHFITTVSEGYSPTPYYTTYNGLLDPYSVRGSWDRYQQKNINNEVLVAYGYGDGGGGPTREMLEVASRLKNGLPGIPKVQSGFPKDYFQRLEKRLENEQVPRWRGELYFEYHRGTYTSIAKNKKNNREVETLLQSLEKIYVHYGLADYPKAELDSMWKKTLLNQFHDTLPGSSIKEVYDQTDKEYAETKELGAQLLNKLLLGQEEEAQNILVYNPLCKDRNIVAKVKVAPNEQLFLNGERITQQATSTGESLIYLPNVPAMSERILTKTTDNQVIDTTRNQVSTKTAVGKYFETEFYKVTFNDSFEIISMIDKNTQREIVTPGQTLNRLVAYEDLPLNFDAWDIDIYYKEKSWPVNSVISAEFVETGDIRESLKITRKFEDSSVDQLIHFYKNSARVDFETTVDWHQQHVLLKAHFPIDVNTLKATFDIQFGNVERPIHTNTSWDQARFEVCGQKWVDLSEGNYGVSVMSDSKYGFNVGYKEIGITLIKSATDPNPEADQGIHQFTYSILPHVGSWKEAQTVEEALDLNTPAIVHEIAESKVKEIKQITNWCQLEEKNILLDTVKKSEKEQQVVARMYEFHNSTTAAVLAVNEKVKRAVLCDLLENELEELEINEQQVVVHFQPFEIQTIKFYL
ncbi:alpha-mannosidase [Enterococcus sp. JM4C]|uniref:alpha-mannosidase n=1 Tax=Candidatus Enterococcus huntleyi TaxID=1857217 RepID=UPI00137972DE|nr:glycoside hydrolase family 38 C-terminal domain-containing protein [Enterococcus sp. JM4C]KAF1298646.1 alpha-mannosidase [Enterococcus sp. JM4C]